MTTTSSRSRSQRQRRTRLRIANVMAAVACVVACATPFARVQAQTTCTTTSTCTFTATLVNIPVLAEVTASTSSFSLAPTGGLTAADLALGYFEPASPLSLVVQTNAELGTTPSTTTLKWNINSSAWSSGCPFALADLTFSTTSTGTKSAVPTTSTNLLTSLRRTTSLVGRTATLYVRVASGWGDTPTSSACTLPLQFTLSAP